MRRGERGVGVCCWAGPPKPPARVVQCRGERRQSLRPRVRCACYSHGAALRSPQAVLWGSRHGPGGVGLRQPALRWHLAGAQGRAQRARGAGRLAAGRGGRRVGPLQAVLRAVTGCLCTSGVCSTPATAAEWAAWGRTGGDDSLPHARRAAPCPLQSKCPLYVHKRVWEENATPLRELRGESSQPPTGAWPIGGGIYGAVQLCCGGSGACGVVQLCMAWRPLAPPCPHQVPGLFMNASFSPPISAPALQGSDLPKRLAKAPSSSAGALLCLLCLLCLPADMFQEGGGQEGGRRRRKPTQTPGRGSRAGPPGGAAEGEEGPDSPSVQMTRIRWVVIHTCMRGQRWRAGLQTVSGGRQRCQGGAAVTVKAAALLVRRQRRPALLRLVGLLVGLLLAAALPAGPPTPSP